MKTLRARLFFYIGGIFLMIAILSYAIPHFFVRKDVDQTSDNINQLFHNYHNRAQKLTDSWISFRFLQAAAQLNAVAETLPRGKKNNWEYGAAIISHEPLLAFVQVTQNQETALIAPENGAVIHPAWAKDEENSLWIKIEEQIFQTRALSEEFFLLIEPQEKKGPSSYQQFPDFSSGFSIKESHQKMYEALKGQENLLFEKAKLIEVLAAHLDQALGVIKIAPSFERGEAILKKDFFFTTPLVQTEPKEEPFILKRDGPYVDLVQVVSKEKPFLALGCSVSRVCQEVAELVQSPVLLYHEKQLLQAFDPKGHNIDLNSLQQQGSRILWQGKKYVPDSIALAEINVDILTPESFLQTINRLLLDLSNNLVTKISLNLLVISLLLFLLALLLLARITKKITQPIALLARASEEIGSGKYEGLHLPAIEKREDEVAVLTHSFHKMVVSLQEREKIRGVLNKVVSKEIATKVLSGSVELGGELRTLTMLFSDIRGFTPLSETMDPPTLIGLLNSYMTRMCRIVDETNGVVDKFVGDEIMALYGAPLELPDHAEKAVQAAVEMMASLKRWNLERKDHFAPISVGIGIHTGVAFSGNMGAENRLNYTVVGANVNLAARLCSAARPMQILVSEATYKALPNADRFNFEKMAPIRLKGIDEPVTVYSIQQAP